MSLVRRIARGGVRAVIPSDTSWLREAFFSGSTSAGKTVTVERSLHLDSVFAAVRVLSEAVGALPLKTYERRRTGGRIDASAAAVYGLLHDEPNPESGALDCWSLVTTHLNTWGDSFLGKEFGAAGRVTALWPIRPDTVRVARVNKQKAFYLRDPETGVERTNPYTAADIIHVRGISLDGLRGLAPISYARETIGGGLAQDEFSHRFYANSALPRGVLSVEGDLSPEAQQRLRREWEAMYRGSRNAHRIGVLDNGAKFQPVTIPFDDAQFVEQRKLTVQSVARIFRIPPSMIAGDSGSSLTYSTVESDAIHFERYSVRPWLVRIEQALARDRDLFPGVGRTMYPEFLTAGLLRSDTKTRYEAYAIALDPKRGWMDRQEVRDAENLPPEPAPDPVLRSRDAMAQIIAQISHSRNGGARDAAHA